MSSDGHLQLAEAVKEITVKKFGHISSSLTVLGTTLKRPEEKRTFNYLHDLFKKSLNDMDNWHVQDVAGLISQSGLRNTSADEIANRLVAGQLGQEMMHALENAALFGPQDNANIHIITPGGQHYSGTDVSPFIPGSMEVAIAFSQSLQAMGVLLDQHGYKAGPATAPEELAKTGAARFQQAMKAGL